MGNCGSPVLAENGQKEIVQMHRVSRAGSLSEQDRVSLQATTIQQAQVIPTKRGGITTSYHLDKTSLGTGAYGVVVRATHLASGSARAIKTIRHSTNRGLKALQQEVLTLQAMDHPNVIKLFEAYEDRKSSHLVFELCEGGELLDRIVATHSFAEDEAALLMQQILRAVRYVHGCDIVHRDIKPQNFLFATKEDKIENNTLKLIDFGFATRCKPGEFLHKRVGTALYVAPQVLEGHYDKQCDVWSAGVTLFALLCGRAPFPGKTEKEIFEKVKKGRFQFEASAWQSVSSDAKDFIRQLLKMSPTERLTAETALQHQWMMRKMPALPRAGKAVPDRQLLQRLQSFNVRHKLERAALNIIARQLDEEMVKDLRQTFNTLDINGDGKLTVEELSSGLVKAGLAKHGLDLYSILAMADADGSGEIDYSEFLAATLDRSYHLTDDALLTAFQVFDRNGDGKITPQELRQVLCSNSDNMEDSCQRVLEILKEVDIGGDGNINFEEFKCMMKCNSDASTAPSISAARSNEVL